MNDALTRKVKLVTRDELYKQVWSKPMTQLAKDYGLSDNGLRKICDKLNVPYPPRGYWAKKEAGQKVIAYRLPAQKDDTPSGTYIRPTKPQQFMSPEMKRTLTEALTKNSQIPVPEKLIKPHPIIAEWLREYEERWERYRKERDPFTRSLWKPTELRVIDKRMHRILQGLFKALEAKGGKVKESDNHILSQGQDK